MKKTYFTLWPLFALCALPAAAQVNIGARVQPANGAILDLNSNQTAEAVRGGLVLSNVALRDTASIPDTPGPFGQVKDRKNNSELAGTLVYNTTDSPCDGLVPGVYIWDGSRWRKAGNEDIKCPATPDDSGNYALKGKSCYDANQTEDCGARDSRPADFDISRTYVYEFERADVLYYSNLTFSVFDPDGLIESTQQMQNYFVITFVPNINQIVKGKKGQDALKLVITARYTDYMGYMKTVSMNVKIQDCACGCSVRAKNVKGGWLTFMCYNLGVSDYGKSLTVQQQIDFSGKNLLGEVIYGGLWQWGRRTDGHENRMPSKADGPYSGPFDYNKQIPPFAAPFYGSYVVAAQAPFDWRVPQTDNLWDGTTPTSDPCPDGWRVAEISDFINIFDGNGVDVKGNNTLFVFSYGNKWTFVNGGGSDGPKASGWKISPNNGATYTLFLPMAGYRTYQGGLSSEGNAGGYWTRSFKLGVNPYYFHFTRVGNFFFNDTQNRSAAYSVRCVSE
ncbi:MAG: hypothetical protein LBR64_03030 [Dysgonamonadaceae bacterium]|jgi:uncharacterized protein (TIGR02145 family)|nr:hypothetical protein [Dysgonamonadaceae bacterium]